MRSQQKLCLAKNQKLIQSYTYTPKLNNSKKETDLSLDGFLKNTLETVMNTERNEYLENLTKLSDFPNSSNSPNHTKIRDKANGYYGRSFNALSKPPSKPPP